MNDPLALLLADGVIDEVRGRLKSGKEADLWLVRHGGRTVAAKVYKARQMRSFRNNASYKEGRQVRDTRTQRAMERGSRFGQAAAEEAWKAKESDALHTLHAAGVRVPTPVLFYEGVLLMELVVDAHGHPAPRLVDARVPREAAAALYADLRGQVVRMLGCDLIHGDLSPYNVLLGSNGPVVIDFPQVVGAAHNSQAESFFHRDLENLRRFFAAIDPALRGAAGDAREIWRAYVRRELIPDFVPSGRTVGPRPPPGDQQRGAADHLRMQHAARAARPDRAQPDLRMRSPSMRAAPVAAEPHRPHGSGRTRRRGTSRPPATPPPEVIRVIRAQPGAAAAPVHALQQRTSAAPAAPGTQPARSQHRRRRRRRGGARPR